MICSINEESGQAPPISTIWPSFPFPLMNFQFLNIDFHRSFHICVYYFVAKEMFQKCFYNLLCEWSYFFRIFPRVNKLQVYLCVTSFENLKQN